MVRLSVAADSAYGAANLPYGIYSIGEGPRRPCVRYGDHVLDLGRLLDDDTLVAPTLNPFMAQGPQRWAEVRSRVVDAAAGDVPDQVVHPLEDVRLHLPFEVTDYVDFYASEQHATNVGRLFRPGNPLMPNWKHLPVSYHGRSASVVVSGTDVVRPRGQLREGVFGPTGRLDIEAELGFVVGVGNRMGEPIPVDEAERHLFGVVLLNDWSARDIQAWEYAPLGPNLGKSFATTISPWVVPMAALEQAQVDTPPQVPAVQPYLALERPWGLDVEMAVEWNGEVVSRPPYAAMYWSPAQMLAHLTVNGAPTRTGDLLGSGTVSGPERAQVGSFIELTHGGAEPVEVAGAKRTFLEDGDEVVITALARGTGGARIGFGEARGRVLAARP